MPVLIRGRPSPDWYDEGVPVGTRPRANFTGPGVVVTDDPANDGVIVAISGSGGDHGALTDLLADDHTQYALLAGRAGGQTLQGDTAASGRLTLRGTANATPGSVLIPDWLSLTNQGGAPLSVAGETELYSFGGQLYEVVNIGGSPIRVVPGEKKAMQYSIGQGGQMEPRGDAVAGMSGRGLFSNLTETSPTAATRTLDANGLYVNYITLAAAASVAGVETAAAVCRRDAQFQSQIRFAISHTTNIRAFIGWSDQPLATMVAADNPVGLYMGLQYSTPRGDTTWRHVRRNGAGTFSNSNTGIAVSTSWLHSRLFGISGLPTIVLLDVALALLAGNALTSAPVNTTNLAFVAGVEAQAAGTRWLSAAVADVAGQVIF